MKFKKIYYLASFCVLYFCANTQMRHTLPKEKKLDKKIIELSIKTDTVIITDEIVKENRPVASGVYLPNSNKIILKYFKTNSTNNKTQQFCATNNNQLRLTLRHEKEHAIKSYLTKDTWRHPPMTRGAIAAQNEIIAPAAEIIEALDYKYEKGVSIPTNRLFIKKAEKQITEIATKQNLTWPLDFNNQQIADIIIECATEHFLKEISRGIYKTTILNAVQNKSTNKFFFYDPHNKPDYWTFIPEQGKWAPLWQFTSKNGNANIWNAASQTQKQKLLNTVDSVVCQSVQPNLVFFTNQKTH